MMLRPALVILFSVGFQDSGFSNRVAPALSHSRAVRLPAVFIIEIGSEPRRVSVTNGNTCGLTWLTMK